MADPQLTKTCSKNILRMLPVITEYFPKTSKHAIFISCGYYVNIIEKPLKERSIYHLKKILRERYFQMFSEPDTISTFKTIKMFQKKNH